ncbi:hypothetical protein ACFL6C_08970 [Myxococcota bacterium]
MRCHTVDDEPGLVDAVGVVPTCGKANERQKPMTRVEKIEIGVEDVGCMVLFRAGHVFVLKNGVIAVMAVAGGAWMSVPLTDSRWTLGDRRDVRESFGFDPIDIWNQCYCDAVTDCDFCGGVRSPFGPAGES